MIASDAVDRILYVAAALGLLWLLVPLVMSSLGLRSVRVTLADDPLAVQPTSGDPSYRARFAQLVALGYQPLGTTLVGGWFDTPLHWHWQEPRETRWLAAPDRRTFVAMHRLVSGEPIRLGAVTPLRGGGVVRTDCPGIGVALRDDARLHLYEVQNVDAADLLHRHRRNVASVTGADAAGVDVRPATLGDLAAEEKSRERLRQRQRPLGAYWRLLLVTFAVPLIGFAVLALGPHAGEPHRLRHLAISVITGSAMFAVVRHHLLTVQVREDALRRHGLRR